MRLALADEQPIVLKETTSYWDFAVDFPGLLSDLVAAYSILVVYKLIGRCKNNFQASGNDENN